MRFRPIEEHRRLLLHRIHRRYHTLTERLRIGPETSAMAIDFTRIADPAAVLDQVAAEEDLRERLTRGEAKTTSNPPRTEPLHLPYWAELWDSAMGLGTWLVAGGLADLGGIGADVLDLGCGMGLAGTVAAALGAKVTFADLERPALLFAAINSLPWRSRVRCRQLNWQRDTLARKFRLIIGADILYERSQWEHLEPFWRRHMADGGTVLLGEPGRQTGDLFMSWIRERGWTLELREQPVPTRTRPIRLFIGRTQG